jgi:hypothetical protein
VGKNVGSIIIYEQDPVKQQTNQWGLLPIVVKFANKDGFSGYENGFIPNIKAHETENNAIILPLGDTDEYLLQMALHQIIGNGLKSASQNVRSFQTVASSADKTPTRKSVYIDTHIHHR